MSEKMTPTANENSFSSSHLDVQMQQAWEQVNAGDTEKAAQLFRGAIDLAESEFGDDTLETARILTDVSTGLYLLGSEHYVEACELLERALEIQTSVEGECNIGCARLHRQLAAMHNSREEYEKAILSLQKAVDIFESIDAFGGTVDASEKDALYIDLKKTLLRADERSEDPDDDEESPAKRLMINCDGRE
jgi:tetratricopeptide (TPR) repeat protein